jgi:hypothetical protein
MGFALSGLVRSPAASFGRLPQQKATCFTVDRRKPPKKLHRNSRILEKIIPVESLPRRLAK